MVILTIITWLRLTSTWVRGLSLSSTLAVNWTRVQIWTHSNRTWDQTLISFKMNLGSGLSFFQLNLSSGLISSSDWTPIEFRIQDGVRARYSKPSEPLKWKIRDWAFCGQRACLLWILLLWNTRSSTESFPSSSFYSISFRSPKRFFSNWFQVARVESHHWYVLSNFSGRPRFIIINRHWDRIWYTIKLKFNSFTNKTILFIFKAKVGLTMPMPIHKHIAVLYFHSFLFVVLSVTSGY